MDLDLQGALILVGFDPDPDLAEKFTHKKKTVLNSLETEGFSCSLDILGLGIKIRQFWSSDPWIRIRNCIRIRSDKMLDPDLH